MKSIRLVLADDGPGFPGVSLSGMNAREAARRIKAINARIRVMTIFVNKKFDLERAALAAAADASAARIATGMPREASR